MTITTEIEIRHPGWCVPSAGTVRVRDHGGLGGCHSADPVAVAVSDGFSVSVSVAQFLGNFGSVAGPAVQIWSESGPEAMLDPDAADQIAAALTAAAARLREVPAAGDFIPVY